MAEEHRIQFESARFVGLEIEQANALALLYFARVDGSALTVTIPAGQLPGLRSEIERKLATAPHLLSRESKTDQS